MYYLDNFVIYNLINCKRCKVGKKYFDNKKTNKNKTKKDINNWFKKKKGVNWGIHGQDNKKKKDNKLSMSLC